MASTLLFIILIRSVLLPDAPCNTYGFSFSSSLSPFPYPSTLSLSLPPLLPSGAKSLWSVLPSWLFPLCGVWSLSWWHSLHRLQLFQGLLYPWLPQVRCYYDIHVACSLCFAHQCWRGVVCVGGGACAHIEVFGTCLVLMQVHAYRPKPTSETLQGQEDHAITLNLYSIPDHFFPSYS